MPEREMVSVPTQEQVEALAWWRRRYGDGWGSGVPTPIAGTTFAAIHACETMGLVESEERNYRVLGPERSETTIYWRLTDAGRRILDAHDAKPPESAEDENPCVHDKVYSDRVLATFPAQVPWICRRCGAEGVDREPMPKDLGEYDRMKREKRERGGE